MPFDDSAMDEIPSLSILHPWKVWRMTAISPNLTSQIRIVPSREPERTYRPSAEREIHPTAAVCPVQHLDVGLAPSASHNLTVLSHEPETIDLPSGAKASYETVSVCPSNGHPIDFPVWRPKLERLLGTSRDPSGDKATDLIQYVCAMGPTRHEPFCVSHFTE
jgi:hypothetical protein